jgi:hypothetical protein
MKRLVMALLCCMPVMTQAGGRSITVSAKMADVFPVAVQALGKQWRLENANKEAGIIAFRTGGGMKSWSGQDASCVLTATGPDDGQTDIGCSTEKRDGHQFTTWGQGGDVQKKAFKAITAALFEKGLIQKGEVFEK